MREIRSSGSVEGAMGNHGSYSDFGTGILTATPRQGYMGSPDGFSSDAGLRSSTPVSPRPSRSSPIANRAAPGAPGPSARPVPGPPPSACRVFPWSHPTNEAPEKPRRFRVRLPGMGRWGPSERSERGLARTEGETRKAGRGPERSEGRSPKGDPGGGATRSAARKGTPCCSCPICSFARVRRRHRPGSQAPQAKLPLPMGRCGC